MSVTNAPGTSDRSGGMAEVRANGETTRYRRGGSGSPVLLLCDTNDERFGPLFVELAARYCVIAPVAESNPSEAVTGVDRLTGFLDGLGLSSVPVVGVGRGAGPAAALARLHQDRVGRLVLLGLDCGEPEHHVMACLEALEGD